MKSSVKLCMLLPGALLAGCGSVAEDAAAPNLATVGVPVETGSAPAQGNAVAVDAPAKAAVQTAQSGARPQSGERPVNCELVVDGRTYIKDTCLFTPMRGDGSFQITKDGYAVQVDVAGNGSGSAYWNAEPAASHVSDPLGSVTRRGGCWTNARARICATALSPQEQARASAAMPAGKKLYPDLPGASSSCLRAANGLRVGSEIVLDNCRVPDDLIFVRKSNGEIGIDRHPELCLDVESPGMMKPPVMILGRCGSGGTKWTISASATRAAPIRSSDNRCATLPLMLDPSAPFPWSLSVASCDSGEEIADWFLADD
ncbi:hypothetical protein [Sphingosinithalassobacter portus]|uniref:hypothetical protein n=1 Tax=Stakelama portus TaxID=2676234 RepID=UPI0011AB584F|nr:hypothetical protein [Sphingosinithalassobacter portus]